MPSRKEHSPKRALTMRDEGTIHHISVCHLPARHTPTSLARARQKKTLLRRQRTLAWRRIAFLATLPPPGRSSPRKNSCRGSRRLFLVSRVCSCGAHAPTCFMFWMMSHSCLVGSIVVWKTLGHHTEGQQVCKLPLGRETRQEVFLLKLIGKKRSKR